MLRADRAGGDTKTPRSRRALKLAQMAVGALREWQVDQAAEREAAGSHWQDTGGVFTTATGTPLGARHIRKMFQDVCERAGLGRDWADHGTTLSRSASWRSSGPGRAPDSCGLPNLRIDQPVTSSIRQRTARPAGTILRQA